MMFVEANGILQHVEVEGPPGAPPVLLLHSIGTSLEIWSPQARALSRAFLVIRPDLRGHGLSEVPAGPYTIDQLVDDAMGLMDALKVQSAHIVGLSLGGLVAQRFAQRAPDRVRRLALVSTALAIGTEALWRDRAQRVRKEGLAGLADEIVARWVPPAASDSSEARALRCILMRTAPEAYAGACEAIGGTDLSAGAKDVKATTLVVAGDRDIATPLASARTLVDSIPSATLVVIDRVAHVPNFDPEDRLSAILLGFLAPASDDSLKAGTATRIAVLGEDYVARKAKSTTDFDRAFQAFITEVAWGRVWSRPDLDRRTRSLVTIAILAALGRDEELEIHLRATKNTGASADDVAAIMLHIAVYAGIPAANHAMRIAKRVFGEEP
jgi:3-oxoadipate enol-lactonase/4-carboxymuconolactone decarboxylase